LVGTYLLFGKYLGYSLIEVVALASDKILVLTAVAEGKRSRSAMRTLGVQIEVVSFVAPASLALGTDPRYLWMDIASKAMYYYETMIALGISRKERLLDPLTFVP